MNIPVVSQIFKIALKILTFILYALTVFSAFGGRINPHFFALPSVFALFLPYLAIATIVAAAGWLCAKKFFTAALGALTVFICLGPITTAIPLHGSKKAEEGNRTFKIMTYNVMHGSDFRIPKSPGNRTFEYIINSGADIVCLQELRYFSKDEIKNFTPSLRDSLYKVYPYRAGDDVADLKILSKYPVKLLNLPAYPRYATQWEGHQNADFFRINVDGTPLTVVNMHMNSYRLSWKEREVVTDIKSISTAKESMAEFKDSIRQKLTSSLEKRADNADRIRKALNEVKGNLIVCGDFNDVPESYAYRLIKGDDLKDAYVETNFGPTFTFNAHRFYFQLDQILYRGNMRALSVTKGKIDSSDHYPLIAEFELLPADSGK